MTQFTATERVEAVAVELEAAAAAQDPLDVLLHAVRGLGTLVHLLEHGEEFTSVGFATTARAEAALSSALPIVADAAGGSIAPETVALRFGMVAALLNLMGREAAEVRQMSTLGVVMDQVDLAAGITHELEVVRRRKSVAARGNPLARRAAIVAATRAVHDGGLFH